MRERLSEELRSGASRRRAGEIRAYAEPGCLFECCNRDSTPEAGPEDVSLPELTLRLH